MTTTDKIKLVVVEECVLGYIFPEYPDTAHILHSSILKGANAYPSDGSIHIAHKEVRTANEKDFDDFRVCFNGYKNNPQEYEFATS